ncbi:hypothetical protein F4780DRAFT_780059 [Xylariomycetidae sp. FL0641]|nr:hypothetical protein F4780DRAFT_780059 [Xylariomycetidae sp. FL0641]
MSNPKAAPFFWRQPLKYLRWATRERPYFVYATGIGFLGPVLLATVPPTLRTLGYQKTPKIPTTYPIPPGPRKTLTGYDD